jgi:hypothetical protein
MEYCQVRIAVCFSGQIRTGVQAATSIKHYIGDFWDNCTFFCHTWNVNTRKPLNANGIYRQGYPLDDSTLNEFREFYKLHGKIVVENYDQIKESKTSNHWNPMHYSWRRSIELMQDYSQITNLNFDFVVKLRPDVLPRSTRSMGREIANCLLKNDKECFFSESTYAAPNGVMDDVIYYATPAIMDRVSKFAYFQEETGMQGLKQYLDMQQIKSASTVQDLSEMGYAILREESLHRDPIADWEGCYNDDMHFYQPKL